MTELKDSRFTISIHALREEGDRKPKSCQRAAEEFLSTPSARRATLKHDRQYLIEKISIHALREEGDEPSTPQSASSDRFLSTPSARRATALNNMAKCAR